MSAESTPDTELPDTESPVRHSPSRRAFMGLAAAGAGAAAVASAVVVPPYLRDPPTEPLPAAAPGSRFAGKVVLVTGGTSGIGEAAVRAFAAEGAAVVFCGRREQLGKQIAESIGGAAHYVRTDVRVPAEVERLVAEVDRRFGRLDVALNNAGIRIEGAAEELSVEQWDDVLDTNLRGIFLSVKYEVPLLERSGGGVILCTTSKSLMASAPAYSASKAGIEGLVGSMAQQYGPHGIRVNAIAPGTTDTALIRPPGLPDPMWAVYKDAWGPLNVSALGRMAQPAEIARAILALCGDDLGYMAGSTVLVGGGPLGGGKMQMPPGFPAR
ncbi:SDR family NAD(P)-dependent oxidoreductase [Nocardia sp. CA-107356]|uniref:SDR family NAD(P)-dependent oxidoreductase n=1 Tax=Nocardia sp. CA-107356 TaxID=3239972 RepID=UPI003D9228AC